LGPNLVGGWRRSTSEKRIRLEDSLNRGKNDAMLFHNEGKTYVGAHTKVQVEYPPVLEKVESEHTGSGAFSHRQKR